MASKIKTKTNNEFFFAKNFNLTNTVLTLINTLIAAAALGYAGYTYNKSIESSEIAAQKANQLFNLQLNTLTRISDSLICEIKTIQEITNQQLGITQQQLKELKGLSKPRILNNKFLLNEYCNTEVANTYCAEIILINTGGREALNIGYDYTIIGYETNKIIAQVKEKIIDKLNSGEEYSFSFNLIPNIKDTGYFYMYFQLSYYDQELSKVFMQDYFYKYEGIMGENENYFRCNLGETQKIKKSINNKTNILFQ